jgi:hypothetical protein
MKTTKWKVRHTKEPLPTEQYCVYRTLSTGEVQNGSYFVLRCDADENARKRNQHEQVSA